MTLNIRGRIRTLLLCALFSSLIPAAVAQTGVSCIAFVANQPTLRMEGVTEPAGDVLIACSGTPVGAQTAQQTLSLYINGTVFTSRQLYTGSVPQNIPTEAALLVNDCVTNSGASSTGASCAPNGTFQGGNPTQGFLQNGALVFQGFTLPVTGGPFQIRLTNLRLDATKLQSGSFAVATVLATFAIQNQQNLVLGAIQPSLQLNVSQPTPTVSQCLPQTVTITNLTIGELVNTAFKSPGSTTANATPGQWYQNAVNSESQTVLQGGPPGWNNPLAAAPGQANQATRIRVNITNLPSGVSVTLPVNVGNSSSSLVATSGGDLGPFSPASGTGITLTNSSSVTYEVRAQSSTAIDSFNIPITISSIGNVGVGQVLVSATYGPTTPETSTAIPRFADTSTLTPLFVVTTCGSAAQLGFSPQPGNGSAGVALTPVVVQVQDSNGNLSPSTAAVTLTSSPPAINTTVNAVNGVATFSSVIFGLPGTYSLIATSSGLASAVSHTFTVSTSTAPTVALDSLSPGASVSGVVTLSGWALDNVIAPGSAIATVQVNVDGALNGFATYGTARPDVCAAYPGRPGCPNVGYTYQLNTAALTPGSHTITVSAVDSDPMPDFGSVTIAVTVVAPTTPPAVIIDNPSNGAALSGLVTVSGWAIDNLAASGTSIASVQVKVDGNPVGNAGYGLSRPDVCGAYPGRPNCPNVGYSFSLDTSQFGPGSHTLTVSATDTDGTPDTGTASVTFTTTGAPPTLSIDSPLPNSVVSGVINISGWAIDNASGIGTAISSVQIKVDGNVVGNATYGIARPDVCAAYPLRPGCPNVGYAFSLNTASLAPGSHTITVSATDSDGTPDVGSKSVGITLSTPTGPPVVYIENPTSGTVLAGTVTVSGWAIDNGLAPGTPIASVQIKVDGVAVGNATYGTSRPDVCLSYPGRPNCPNVGFTFVLDTSQLANGSHMVTAVATDSDGVPDSGSWTVAVTVGPQPLVSIDAPSAGSSVSGTVTVSGWAVDFAGGTAIGAVSVSVDGNLLGNAIYGLARPDVCAVYPGRAGCPNVGYTFSLNTANLSNGSHTLTVTASDRFSTPYSRSKSVTFTVNQPLAPPLVVIDTPASGAALSGSVTISGWAVDNALTSGTPIGSVQIKVDGNVVGNAAYGSPRPDVCAAYPARPNCPNVGWTFALNTAGLVAGSHTLTAVATDTDGTPDSASATVTISVGTPPLVRIDSPSAGSILSGIVTVSGWAIDNAAGVGTAISGVQVKLDGVVVGNATYGVTRTDVCAAYPGRPGCPNVGYTFSLNTTGLASGNHTISVTATDTDGSPDSGSASVAVTK